MRHRTDSKNLAVVLLSVALGITGSQSLANAQDANTMVLEPAGPAKARHLKRVKRSLAKSAKKIDGTAMAKRNAGALTGRDNTECVTDEECLSQAGASIGAARIVGVRVEPSGQEFSLTFVMVHVITGKELTRITETIKKAELRKAPGRILERFINDASFLTEPTTGTEAPPAPGPAPPPAPEPEPAPDPATPPPTDPIGEPAPAPVDPAIGPDYASGTATTPPGLTSNVKPHDDGKRIHVGLHTGVLFPQLQSELGTTVGVELELGYRVWSHVTPYLSVAYAQPTVDGDLSDPRLPGAYETSTTQRELTISLGVIWRFFRMGTRLNAYAGMGARAWLLETITDGESAGQEFLENRETSTRYGAALLGGVEYLLGPGAAVFELDMGGSDLPHLITGDVSTTAIAATIGYRLLF